MAEQTEGAPEEQQQTPQELVGHWLKQLKAADRHEETWRQRAEKIVRRYRNEREDAQSTECATNFNILYANVEVLKGVMYQKKPVPDVRRRFLDKDPVAREAAKVLERALSYSLDAPGYDFDAAISAVVEDILLPGRGVARVKYVPTIHMGQPQLDPATGQVMPPQEQVVYEEVQTCYVPWKHFRYQPARQWEKVDWVAFGELLSRDELVRQFGQLGQACDLNHKDEDREEGEEEAKRALVWSVWDKVKREVLYISDGSKDQPLKVEPDPLRIEGFYPTPKPVYAISTTDSLIPVIEYTQYQEQAIELEDVTARIKVLTGALKLRGVYDAEFPELEQLHKKGDNQFLPVLDFARFAEKGGLEKLISALPTEAIAKILLGLYTQREQIKATIYEITGIADIVRGSTKASETLGAQELKSQYANIRINPRQGMVANYVRDLLRIKSEIIAEHFQPQTLQLMTNLQLPMQADLPMLIQAGKATPETPTWEAVLGLLKNDKLRGFRVDIETDSTVRPDADTEQKNRTEFLGALTGFMEKMLPAVQMGLVPMKVASELTMFGVRAFKVGPQLEEVLQQWAEGQLPQQQAPQGPDPEAQKVEAQAAEGDKDRQHDKEMLVLEKTLDQTMPTSPAAASSPAPAPGPSPPAMAAPAPAAAAPSTTVINLPPNGARSYVVRRDDTGAVAAIDVMPGSQTLQ